MLKKIGATAWSFIQIAFLLLIITPLCVIVGNMFGDAERNRMLLDMAGQIKYFQPFTDIASIFSQYHAADLINNTDAYLENLVNAIDSIGDSMFQLLNVTLSVAVFNLFWSFLKGKFGLPIFSTVFGVFLGYILVALYPLPWMASAFLMLLYVVVDMIFVQSSDISLWGLAFRYLKSCLKFGLEMIATLWCSGLVAVLLVFWYFGAENIGVAIFITATFAIPFLLTALFRFFFDKK